ncbi:phosphatidate cytidylyltransferase [Holospora obtusa F1]|uniref:Phosphatidate cytidylyltransferase n=1 Tax=Holospora obtusa F1 TaxID=1399147 RepID=W6TD99_HOLOB|nr:phosphatidate cytidylyltransferase [Holospora obtusa]ETZ06706.1 phosphatidate cytidylyltransferase [Holospora obtusa F1]
MKSNLFSHLKERALSSIWMAFCFLVLFGIIYFFKGSSKIAQFILLGLTAGCLIEWTYACFLSQSWKKHSIWILGVVFIVMGSNAFLKAFHSRGWESWIVIIASSIFTDTFAYFFGSWFKGPKIFPAISASKTYSGAIGGLVMACICTVILGKLIHHPMSWMQAGTLSLCAQTGDFLESWAKRQLKIKDSGNWIKGHGGVMDRTDSWWTTAIGYSMKSWT